MTVSPLAALRAFFTVERGALLFTALTGLILAVEIQTGPHGVRPVIDERAYIEWARQIASGHLVSASPFYMDPLPAYVLAALFAVSGGSLLFCRLAFVALGVGTVAVLGRVTRSCIGEREAPVTMWLLALYGPFVFSLGWLLKEPLTLHLAAWALWLARRAADERSRLKPWLLLGAVFGLMLLCRGNFVALLPFLLGWAFAVWRRAVLPLAAGLLLALAPASLHNFLASGEPMPLNAAGGMNFFMGNNPDATGTYHLWDFSHAKPFEERVDYQREAERRAGHALTPQQASAYWFGEGLRFWRDSPGAALELLALKAWLLLHDYEIPDNYGFSCFRTHFTPVLWLAPLSFGALLGLALWGAYLALRTDRRAALVAAFALLYGGSVAVFFVLDRYRLPLCLPLCVFAARALTEVWTRRPRSALLKPALWVATVTALAFIATPISRDADKREGFCVAQAGLLLYLDGHAAEAQPLLDFGRAHGQAEWIQRSLDR